MLSFIIFSILFFNWLLICIIKIKQKKEKIKQQNYLIEYNKMILLIYSYKIEMLQQQIKNNLEQQKIMTVILRELNINKENTK